MAPGGEGMSRARDLVLQLEGIARETASANDERALGHALCRALESMVSFDVCYLLLEEADSSRLRVVYGRGLSKEERKEVPERVDEGLLDEVMRQGTTIMVPPTPASPERLAAIGMPKARSVLLQPVETKGRIVGAVALGTTRANSFDEFDLALSAYVVKLVGVAWERMKQEREVLRRNAILSALAQVTDRLLHDRDWEMAVNEILERLGTVTGSSRCYVFENKRSPEGTLLTSQRFEWVAEGVEPEIDNPDLQDTPLREAGFNRWCQLMTRGEHVVGLVREFPSSEQAILAPQGIRSILVVPIIERSRWWGFLGFDDCERERDWSRMEIDTLTTAAHALGAAIQAARIRRRMEKAQRLAQETAVKLERALEGTVGALLRIMETRDQRLANHQQRVAELALAIAQQMGLDRDRQQATWLGALLHDLGKLSLPFWLVAKGEPEDPAERSRYKAHVRLGQQVLAPLDLPWPIDTIVGQHHERPDGRGYPQGLTRTAIRTEALIIRVADYVETRVTQLSYGEGRRLEQVLDRLEAGMGTRFDEGAVEACLELFRDGGFFFTTEAAPLDKRVDAEFSSVPVSQPSSID